MKGYFIGIDGTDGSGKKTQTDLLVQRLASEGYDVEKLSFPSYGNPQAYFVEQYLNKAYGDANSINPKLASLFYALDRYHTFFSKDDGEKPRLLKALDEGKFIVSDRYVAANKGHQGGKISDPLKRKAYLDWLDELEFGIAGLPRPDMNILLYVPWHIAQQKVDEKGHREYVGGNKRDAHEDDENHLKNAEESYLYLIDNEPGWVKIDCTLDGKLRSREEVHDMIWAELEKKILNAIPKPK